MRRKRSDIEGSIAVETTHEQQLMTLLKEMVREKGASGAAQVLEIDRRTVAASIEKGRLSWRVRETLERAIQYGAGSAAAEQRERNHKLERPDQQIGGEASILPRGAGYRPQRTSEATCPGPSSGRSAEWRF